jgi:hypothetical protein
MFCYNAHCCGGGHISFSLPRDKREIICTEIVMYKVYTMYIQKTVCDYVCVYLYVYVMLFLKLYVRFCLI